MANVGKKNDSDKNNANKRLNKKLYNSVGTGSYRITQNRLEIYGKQHRKIDQIANAAAGILK